VWDEWYPDKRSQCLKDVSKFYGDVRFAGWVYRLPSGIDDAEIDNKIRGKLREQGIRNLIQEARKHAEDTSI
jgi:hypothetical protein